jgi:signal transduction histidine kinase
MVDFINRYIDGALHASSTLQNMINDLLDMAKMEQAVFSFDYQEFNFVKTIIDVFHILEYHAEAKKISLLLQFDQI